MHAFSYTPRLFTPNDPAMHSQAYGSATCDAECQVMLDAHNRWREQHCAGKLSWDVGLAEQVMSLWLLLLLWRWRIWWWR